MGKKESNPWFFGWTNIKWLIREVRDIYTSKDSHFSKKRIESSFAFIIGQGGMIYYFLQKIEVMTTSDITVWAGIEFAIAGYIINQIQGEKKVSYTQDESLDVPPSSDAPPAPYNGPYTNQCPTCDQWVPAETCPTCGQGHSQS